MINRFQGEYRFLSNFWYPQQKLTLGDNIWYPTIEHAYQAAKSTNLDIRKIISNLPKPGLAKKMGREISIRPDWESIKYDTMFGLIEQKFGNPYNFKLRRMLLATGDQELIEGNLWHDRYWGICYCRKCKGVGENNLGKLLMEQRKVLQEA